MRDLRDFARLDQSDLHDTDINAGIESTVNIIHGMARKKHVEIALQLRPLPLVAVYPAKINQVIMNLISNAIDAAKDGGHVTVQTEVEERHIRITVTDDGHGVPEEIRDRIFDPFFTTKPIGQGTGLGLSISYGIVQDHGGTMHVSNVPGGGAASMYAFPCNRRRKNGEGGAIFKSTELRACPHELIDFGIILNHKHASLDRRHFRRSFAGLILVRYRDGLAKAASSGSVASDRDVSRGRLREKCGPGDVFQSRIDALRGADDEGFYEANCFERDNAAAPTKLSLRLGNHFYPHMKLVIEPTPDGTASLFRADTHDKHIRPSPGSKEYAGFCELMDHNRKLSEAIESAWEKAGLLTFKKYLRQDLARRQQSH